MTLSTTLTARTTVGSASGLHARPASLFVQAWASCVTRPALPPLMAGRRVADTAAANTVLMRALGLVGTPYRYGGNSPQGGFDCSGLVQFVFRDSAGVRLPRSTRELAAIEAPEIERGDLRPGDLVFFHPGGGATSHIGIYVGEGRFVHAPSTGGTVRLDLLDSAYWRAAWAGGRRVL